MLQSKETSTNQEANGFTEKLISVIKTDTTNTKTKKLKKAFSPFVAQSNVSTTQAEQPDVEMNPDNLDSAAAIQNLPSPTGDISQAQLNPPSQLPPASGTATGDAEEESKGKGSPFNKLLDLKSLKHFIWMCIDNTRFHSYLFLNIPNFSIAQDICEKIKHNCSRIHFVNSLRRYIISKKLQDGHKRLVDKEVSDKTLLAEYKQEVILFERIFKKIIRTQSDVERFLPNLRSDILKRKEEWTSESLLSFLRKDTFEIYKNTLIYRVKSKKLELKDEIGKVIFEVNEKRDSFYRRFANFTRFKFAP